MKIIAHRRNTIEDLKSTPLKYGIELDLRSNGGDIIVQHDPFKEGERFVDWLTHYRHGTLILNVKEEGLEEQLIELMRARLIEDYFFLDQSFPFMIRWAECAQGRSAVRVSEFESPTTALTVAGKVKWVWVDCFTRFPLNQAEAMQLKDAGLRLCLVSPELQGRGAEFSIPALAQELTRLSIHADAICTKRPDLWERYVQP